MTTEIVVLDSVPLDNGDLDWSPLRALGRVTFYDNTAPHQVVERIGDASIVFTNKVRIGGQAIESASATRMIGVTATGYDVVDIEAARHNGITVCNVPSYSSHFTAQTAFALLLELAHHVGEHDQAVRDGQWAAAGRFSFWNYPLIELNEKTLLIVGLGRIGQRMARIAEATGMRVIAAALPGRAAEPGPYPRIPLEEALPQADVISLHCPLTPATRGIVNAETLALMKPTAFIVNTARGLLIDEVALADVLHAGKIGGYAGDVLSVEPPAEDNPLLHAPRCIVTPHISWASIECRQRLLSTSVENLRAFLSGAPQNVVS